MVSAIVAFVCLLELAVKTLLLKTTHTLPTGVGGFKLELTCKPPSIGLALISYEVTVQGAKVEGKLKVLPIYEVYEEQQNDQYR